MTFLKRPIAWLMFLCLISGQFHVLVPHHHHGDEAPVHLHVLDRNDGLAHHADSALDQNDPHPEVVPHDELALTGFSTPHVPQFEMAIVLPERIVMVLAGPILERPRAFFAAEHPYATGPPGTTPSRAPPVSLTA